MFKRLAEITRTFKREIRTYQLVARHPRCPKSAKWLLAIAIGYALLPFDFIPDFIPIVGHLDDVVIVPSLVILAIRLVPHELLEECRTQALSESIPFN